jgi:hypothetical protein
MDDGWVESCAKVFITIIVSNLRRSQRQAPAANAKAVDAGFARTPVASPDVV